MEEANLLVSRIKDGTVIDHIDGGKGLQVLEALDVDGTSGVNPLMVISGHTANGYVLFGDHYADNGTNPERITTFGLQYSGAGALWGWGVKPKHNADNTYLASHNGWSSIERRHSFSSTESHALGLPSLLIRISTQNQP